MPRSTLEPCDTAARAVDEADFGLLISAISTKLINSSLAQSHHHIEEALALLGRGGSKDRCYVFRFSDDYSTMSNTYEWTNDGIQGYQHELQNIPTQSMAYFYETIREHGLIVVNHIDELPPEVGAFRDELVRENIGSMMAVGMYLEHRLVGFVGSDLVNRYTTWTERDIRQKRLVADMIVNTIARHETEQRLRLTEQKLIEANAKLVQLAREDGLTGVMNRRGLDESLELELRRAIRVQQPLALLMVDVDSFKRINDNCGHVYGDEVLAAVADILQTHFKRSGEVVARFGGDEFLVVCPQVNIQELYDQAEKVRQHVQQLKSREDAPVSVSIGLHVTTPAPGMTRDALMREVDAAVYKAKQNGRNRVEIHPSSGKPTTTAIKS